MGYKAISDSLISIGRSASQILWLRVRNNFRSHEDRILELEGSLNSVPSGFIFEYAGATAPTGYLFCDGSVVSRSTYADLFAICGTSFNTGSEGGTEFRLPDLRGRCQMGSGTGTGLTARTLADKVGAETVTLSSSDMPTHNHSVSGTHRHMATTYDPIDIANENSSKAAHDGASGATLGTPTRTTDSKTTGVTVNNSNGGGAHNNMQPSLVLNFIIKT